MEGTLKQIVLWQRIKQNKCACSTVSFLCGVLLLGLLGVFWFFFFVLFVFYHHERQGVRLAGFFWSDMILTMLSNVLIVPKIEYKEK